MSRYVMAILQVRIDENEKEQASSIFKSLGLDLSTAVRMFICKSILENGLPFDVKTENKKEEN